MTADAQIERLRAELARLVPTVGAQGTGVEHFIHLFGLFLSNVPDFIVLMGTDGTILFLNRARPGKTIAEVVGHNIFEYMPDDGRMRAAFDHVVRSRETVTLESTARFTDGSLHEFLTRIAPVFNGDRIVALASIATEITAQKRAAAALRESEEMLRVAVTSTGMGLWSFDVKRDVVVWDDAMCRIWGVTQDTAPRTIESYLRTIHPEDTERQRQRVARVIETAEYPAVEQRIVRPDGTIRRVLSKASVVRAADGSVERMIGGVLDVTEQRELEERSRQAQKLEAIGQLSAGIAHNFNNLLTTILPNIEFAMDGAAPEAAVALQAAREAGLRAAELVRQLMTFAGRARPSERRVGDVRTLVDRTAAMCRRAFDQRIELSVRCPDEEQPVVADATQIEQAVLNLLINARDAVLEADVAPKRVVVEVQRTRADTGIGLEAGRDYVCVRVIDNGIGMDAATSSRIYEPFFTTKDVGKGTGLGLSTARTIVQEHGGALECKTRKGVGTTFSLFLPLAAAPGPREERAVPLEEKRGSQTIYVVDDEAPVREVMRRMLERAGYTVHLAASGGEALDRLSSDAFLRSIDLVLLDMSMPGMPGDVVRAEIGKRAPHLKVAYFSGGAVDVSSDVVGVVEKPTTPAELVRKVRQFLERPGI